MPYCLYLCPKALNFLSPYCGKMSSTYSHFIILYFLTYSLHSMRGAATSISKTISLSSSRNYVIIHLEYFGCSLARCYKPFKNPCIACSLLLCFLLFMALFFMFNGHIRLVGTALEQFERHVFFVFATRGLAFYAVAAINAEVVVKLGEEAIIAAALGDLQGDARA